MTLFWLPQHRYRYYGHRHALPWLLSCVLLVQALIPIQAHTSWSSGANGLLVLVCSWKESHEIVFAGGSDRPIRPDEYSAAACVFSLLLGTAIMSAAIVSMQTLLQLASLQVVRGSDPIDLRPPYRQAIRAPPVS